MAYVTVAITGTNFVLGILISSIASAILGHLQLVRKGIRIRHLLIAIVAFMVSLAAVLLIFRAVSTQAFP